jgi:hypothetical protein
MNFLPKSPPMEWLSPIADVLGIPANLLTFGVFLLAFLKNQMDLGR